MNKTVSFVGLDDKRVDEVAERGHLIRKVYRIRRKLDKEWKQKEKENKMKMEGSTECVAFLCYVDTLQQEHSSNNNNESDEKVNQIFDLPFSGFIYQSAVEAKLIGAEATKRNLPRSLLQEWPCPWERSLLRLVQAWLEAASAKGLYSPSTDHTARAVKSLTNMLSVLSDADIQVLDGFLKEDVGGLWSEDKLQKPASALKVAIEANLGKTYNQNQHFVDRCTSLEWLHRATNGMSMEELVAALTGANGLAPHVSGHISSSSSESGSATVEQETGSLNTATSSRFDRTGTSYGSIR